MTDATERLTQDLHDAGIALDEVRRVTRLYDRALGRASNVDWERLYRATFSALRRTDSTAPHSRSAVESLLRLLEDDFGTALFGTEAVAILRARCLSLAGDAIQR